MILSDAAADADWPEDEDAEWDAFTVEDPDVVDNVGLQTPFVPFAWMLNPLLSGMDSEKWK